ncbi:hypothetical protein C5Y41_07480 [Rahnella variigena]|jgi:ABC-type Na+ transport system ATPase subunit NatA|uniref:hypothetical protein n=1 Tax=Rahnella variigena TaxID=574964 RepID=UPI00101B9FF5|nr:hypothetical protein [Rahnella variigena]RYJ17087.1 hypothetical protein C5Y41_07480 [Rahnella variigena]
MNGLRIFVTEDFHDFMTDSKLSEKDILKSAHELARELLNISDMQLSKDLSLGLIIEVKQHD